MPKNKIFLSKEAVNWVSIFHSDWKNIKKLLLNLSVYLSLFLCMMCVYVKLVYELDKGEIFASVPSMQNDKTMYCIFYATKQGKIENWIKK